MTDLSRLNSNLKSKASATSYGDAINDAAKRTQDAKKLNTSTIMGKDVEQEVNGFVSLDNQSKTDTASQLTQITSKSDIYPKVDNTLKIPIGDELKSPKEAVSSMTGIVPPDESISIVSLGGAALDDMKGTIEDGSARKSSLLSSISNVAASATAQPGGLDADLVSGINDMKGKLDKVGVDDKGLLGKIGGAISSVSGFAGKVASDVASSAGTLLDKVTAPVSSVLNDIDDGLSSAFGSLNNAVSDMGASLQTNLQTTFGTAQNLFEDLTGSVGSILTGLLGSGTELDDNFLTGILNDVMEGGDINLARATKSLTLKDSSISRAMRDVINDIDAKDTIDFNEQVEGRARATGISTEEINNFKLVSSKVENALGEVDTTISGSIVSEAGEFFTEDLDLQELAKRYSAGYIREFTYVNSKEEMSLELVKMTRPASEVVVHASETYTNANIGAEEIQLRHNEAGHVGIQYHFVIRRDGTVQRGLPVDNVSTASDINGHKPNCIDVCLVGGVNVATEADNPLLNLSASSFTIAQMKSLEGILEAFYQRVPGGQVFGHNDIDQLSQDPYFDVRAFVENKFGKKSVYEDPLTESSLSRDDLKLRKAI